MMNAYTRFGYDLIEVPKVSVLERAEFIIGKLKMDIKRDSAHKLLMPFLYG